MMKLVFAVALAAVLSVPEAATGSLLQRSNGLDRNFETHLPRVDATVPWLDINTRTKMPKGDFPLGRDAASVGRFVLPSRPDMQVSTNFSTSGRM